MPRHVRTSSTSSVILADAAESAVQRTTGRPPRWNWKRTSFNVNYSTGRIENNTDGAYSLPASGSPEGEWGPVPGEIRKHRFNIGISSDALKNLNANINLNASTGTPYTITTGHDDNGDLVFNDRPAGVGRNTQWTPGQWNVNGFPELLDRHRQKDGAGPRRHHRALR